MRRTVALAVAAAAFLAVPLFPGAVSAADAPVDGIDAEHLAASIRFLASDELEGRGPGSAGDRLARRYLATEMEGMGLAPGFPGEGGAAATWFQPFPMVGIESHAPASWSFAKGGATLDLRWNEDWVGTSGTQSAESSFAGAEVVFVGYGIQAPEYGWDDFKGTDLKGKVLLMLNNDPDWDDALFAGKRRLYYGRWTYKYESAARQGAAAAVILHTTPSASYPWQVVQSGWTGERFELAAGDEPRTAVNAWVTEGSAEKLVALGGRKLADLVAAAKKKSFRPVPLGVTTSLAMTNSVHQVETANVGGLLRGSDPELADELVVYTAHHDHLGVGDADATGDTIYNGAVDNASGSSEVLAIARAFSRLPAAERPRRSILFLFVAAEEQGLLGSEYYSLHPSVPVGRIAVNVNLDSANIYGRTKDITYVGYGKSSLDAVVDRAAAAQGRVVRGDQAPEKGSFYRSDQFNFARRGVPAVYVDPGTDFLEPDAKAKRAKQEAYDATCYHQACDEIDDSWSYDGMVEDARLAFAIGRAVADADAMPTWNPGDEFEAARKASLAKGN